MSRALLAAMSATALLLGFVLAEAVKQVLAREYDSWAPALARILVRLAGLIHPPRASEWGADVSYLQLEEKISGLWPAAAHLAAAPRLTGAHFARRLCAAITRRDAGAADLLAAIAAGSRLVPEADTEWLRFRCEEAGQPYDQAENVYRLGMLLVREPEIVTFVRAADGGMRGFTVGGGGEEAVCVGATYYARHRSRIERAGRRVAVVPDPALAPLADIAGLTANFFGETLPESTFPLTLVFESGSPDLRLLGASQVWWVSMTEAKGQQELARRALCSRWARLFEEPHLVIGIPPLG